MANNKLTSIIQVTKTINNDTGETIITPVIFDIGALAENVTVNIKNLDGTTGTQDLQNWIENIAESLEGISADPNAHSSSDPKEYGAATLSLYSHVKTSDNITTADTSNNALVLTQAAAVTRMNDLNNRINTIATKSDYGRVKISNEEFASSNDSNTAVSQTALKSTLSQLVTVSGTTLKIRTS